MILDVNREPARRDIAGRDGSASQLESIRMQAYRIETTLTKDGSLTLVDLPFGAGDTVKVTIVAQRVTAAAPDHYPLRGTPVQFVDPTEPVAESDWESEP